MMVLSGKQFVGEEDQVLAQFRQLAQRLDEIAHRWPRALRTSGSMLGMLQFMANETEMARATFEEALKANPYDRQNYNALMGLALQAEDWAEVERIIRRRMAVNPAAEDHVLLGKAFERQGKPDRAVLEEFRAAIIEFPDAAIGYVAGSGWLLRMGLSDDDAEVMLRKGLEIEPRNAYGNAVEAALCLLQGEPEGAKKALARSLRSAPKCELAQTLRTAHFQAQ